MNKKQYGLIALLALVGGLIGGMVSAQFFTINPVHAQKKSKPANVIEANEFRLVDEKGKVLAELKERTLDTISLKTRKVTRSLPTGEPVLVMYGKYNEMSLSDTKLHIRNKGLLAKMRNSILLYLNPEPYFILQQNEGIGPFVHLQDEYGPRASLFLKGGVPTFRLIDEKGQTRTVLGKSDLEVTATGETQKRTESSIVLFGRDGKTIWSVP